MFVLVVGGGKVGYYLSKELIENGHEVVLMEKDRARAAQIVDELGSIVVPQDGCEGRFLRLAGANRADIVAAVTGDDEDNLVISLLAKQEYGVPRVVARVNNPGNEWMFTDSWGVDVSVSTPHLLTALVQEAVSVGTLVRLLSFEQGQASLIETTLTASAPVVDRELAECRFPRDSTVVAVIRRDRVVVPRGDTVFQEGDEVLVLVTPDSEADVRELLTEPR